LRARSPITSQCCSNLLVEVYNRLSKSCETINDLNRLHIALERRMTPSQQLALIRHLENQAGFKLQNAALGKFLTRRWSFGLLLKVRKMLSRILRRLEVSLRMRSNAKTSTVKVASDELAKGKTSWHNRLSTSYMMSKLHPDEVVPERWRRKSLGSGTTLYKRIDRPSQMLVVSFTGKALRMMAGLPDYLWILEELDCDLVLVNHSSKKNLLDEPYPRIVPVRPLLARLAELVRGLNYQTVYSVGTSGGATSAILSALYFQPDTVLAIGPIIRHFQNVHSAEIHEIAQVVRDRKSKIVIAHGADAKRDSEVAHLWRKAVSAKIIVAKGAGHSALLALDEQFGLVPILTQSSVSVR